MPISGTIILCDKVFTTNNGQHVIAGTYTTWTARVGSLRQARHAFSSGLNLYIRFRPEHSGKAQVTVRIKDERREVWDQSWLQTNFEVPVAEDLPRLVELAVTTPAFNVDVATPESEPEPRDILLRNSIELSIDEQLVATTPFDVRFVKPQER